MERFIVSFAASITGDIVIEAANEVDAAQAVVTEASLRDLLDAADSVMIDVHEVEVIE